MPRASDVDPPLVSKDLIDKKGAWVIKRHKVFEPLQQQDCKLVLQTAAKLVDADAGSLP